MNVQRKIVPSSDEAPQPLYSRIGARLARFGKVLLEVAFVCLPFFVGLRGGISKTYEWLQGIPPLPKHEMYLFDNVGGLAVSACFALFVACWEFRLGRTELEKHGRKLEKRIIE